MGDGLDLYDCDVFAPFSSVRFLEPPHPLMGLCYGQFSFSVLSVGLVASFQLLSGKNEIPIRLLWFFFSFPFYDLMATVFVTIFQSFLRGEKKYKFSQEMGFLEYPNIPI